MELISTSDAALHLAQMGWGLGSAWGVWVSLNGDLGCVAWLTGYGRGVDGWLGLVGVLVGACGVGV